jgi:hypothetical protein
MYEGCGSAQLQKQNTRHLQLLVKKSLCLLLLLPLLLLLLSPATAGSSSSAAAATNYCIVTHSSMLYAVRLNALNLVLNFLVQILQQLNVIIRCVPVAAAVSLKESSDHVSECIRVSVQQALAHVLVLDEHIVGVLVDEVVHLL